jgi:hypothetical protein
LAAVKEQLHPQQAHSVWQEQVSLRMRRRTQQAEDCSVWKKHISLQHVRHTWQVYVLNEPWAANSHQLPFSNRRTWQPASLRIYSGTKPDEQAGNPGQGVHTMQSPETKVTPVLQSCPCDQRDLLDIELCTLPCRQLIDQSALCGIAQKHWAAPQHCCLCHQFVAAPVLVEIYTPIQDKMNSRAMAVLLLEQRLPSLIGSNDVIHNLAGAARCTGIIQEMITCAAEDRLTHVQVYAWQGRKTWEATKIVPGLSGTMVPADAGSSFLTACQYILSSVQLLREQTFVTREHSATTGKILREERNARVRKLLKVCDWLSAGDQTHLRPHRPSSHRRRGIQRTTCILQGHLCTHRHTVRATLRRPADTVRQLWHQKRPGHDQRRASHCCWLRSYSLWHTQGLSLLLALQAAWYDVPLRICVSTTDSGIKTHEGPLC